MTCLGLLRAGINRNAGCVEALCLQVRKTGCGPFCLRNHALSVSSSYVTGVVRRPAGVTLPRALPVPIVSRGAARGKRMNTHLGGRWHNHANRPCGVRAGQNSCVGLVGPPGVKPTAYRANLSCGQCHAILVAEIRIYVFREKDAYNGPRQAASSTTWNILRHPRQASPWDVYE
jgi:hypothetical protein